MKIGQKLVCIRSKGVSLVYPITVGDIYTFDGYDSSVDGFIFLREVVGLIQTGPYKGQRESYRGSDFRPIDETFGEETAERLEKEFISQPEPAFV